MGTIAGKSPDQKSRPVFGPCSRNVSNPSIPMPNPHTRNLSAPSTGASQILLTFPQAAAELAISRRTLARLVSRGEFPPALKIGRSSRIDRADLAAYLDKLRRARGDKLGTS
jgi:excisionase family DNA binding protein